MTEDNGKQFLELIDEQNNIQWSILSELIKLIKSDWNLPESKKEIELLVQRHTEITVKLNSLDSAG